VFINGELTTVNWRLIRSFGVRTFVDEQTRWRMPVHSQNLPKNEEGAALMNTYIIEIII
jgi:hypothetical protein